MSRFDIPPPLPLALSVLAGVTVLGLSSWAMSSVARPGDYQARLAALEQSVAEIERDASVAQTPLFGEKTLCQGAQLTAATGLRNTLVRQAGAAGMTIRTIDALPGSRQRNLAAIDVSFTAEGPYEGAVRLIGLLETSRPEVFVDGVELSPGGGRTRLKVKGRAFCWSSARP